MYAAFPVEDDRRAERLVVHAVFAQRATVSQQAVVVDRGILALLVLDIRVLLPAVVAHEDEQRVLNEPAALDVVDQPTDAVIPPGEVGVVELGRFQ